MKNLRRAGWHPAAPAHVRFRAGWYPACANGQHHLEEISCWHLFIFRLSALKPAIYPCWLLFKILAYCHAIGMGVKAFVEIIHETGANRLRLR
jgi:hypothetical protein